jgi:hypothetical protein
MRGLGIGRFGIGGLARQRITTLSIKALIYNEMYSEGLEKPSNFTLNKRITPKKNRAVLFDGLKYHSSSKPVNFPTRFIVNVDFN